MPAKELTEANCHPRYIIYLLETVAY